MIDTQDTKEDHRHPTLKAVHSMIAFLRGKPIDYMRIHPRHVSEGMFKYCRDNRKVDPSELHAYIGECLRLKDEHVWKFYLHSVAVTIFTDRHGTEEDWQMLITHSPLHAEDHVKICQLHTIERVAA